LFDIPVAVIAIIIDCKEFKLILIHLFQDGMREKLVAEKSKEDAAEAAQQADGQRPSKIRKHTSVDSGNEASSEHSNDSLKVNGKKYDKGNVGKFPIPSSKLVS
jgi:hypothetical protein